MKNKRKSKDKQWKSKEKQWKTTKKQWKTMKNHEKAKKKQANTNIWKTRAPGIEPLRVYPCHIELKHS